VARAQGRSGSRNYAALKLPAETRNYVPKLIAVRNIIRDPAAHGLQLAPMANEPYFMPIKLKRPIEARMAAKLAEMSLEDLVALNPGFQRRVIHTGAQDMLLLPADRVETFQFNLHRKGLEKASLQTYAAKKGESLSSIATSFDVSVDWLKEHNPLNLWRGKLTHTQDLVVPRAVASKPVAKPRVSEARPKAAPTLRKHTVRKGETLMKLARLYEVEVTDIKRLNDITDRIKPGMELDIPTAAAG
jgi:membrane-bound lytic murein transglycosylase D